MFQTHILINDIEDIKRFVAICATSSGKTILSRDSQSIDAKSLLGVFALDTSQPTLFMYDDASLTSKLQKYTQGPVRG